MDRFASVNTEELERKVKERQAQIKKIVSFVEEITREIGETIKRYQGSSHTNLVRKSDGFGDFSFIFDTGQNMFGGNSLDVWYHPTEKRIDTKKVKPVLSVYYQVNLDECEVRVFDESGAWQPALERIIKRKSKIIAQMKKEGGDRQEKRRLQSDESRKRARLLADAERLRL